MMSKRTWKTSTTLTIVNSPTTSTISTTMQKVLHIGRSKDNEIILADPNISKHHAQLLIQSPQEVGIVDLNSTNGTMVNGKRIQGYTRLEKGDVVHLGTHLLTWQTYVKEFATAPAPPQPVEQVASPVTTGASQRQTQQIPPQQPVVVQVQAPPTKRSSGLRSLIWVLGVLTLIGIGVAVVLQSAGISLEAALAKPKTFGLSVQCNPVLNFALGATSEMVIQNSSERTHKGVTVRVRGFDISGKESVSKLVTALESIPSRNTYTQPFTLPGRVHSCTCEVVDSHPQ